jgi:hypothetical protein
MTQTTGDKEGMLKERIKDGRLKESCTSARSNFNIYKAETIQNHIKGALVPLDKALLEVTELLDKLQKSSLRTATISRSRTSKLKHIEAYAP